MNLHNSLRALLPALLSACILLAFNASFAQSGPTSAPIGSSPTAPAAPAPGGALPNDEQRAAYEKAFQETLGKPSDPEALANFAELAVRVGDIEGAISALERLLLLDADQPEVKLELGVLYYRLGATEPARAYLEAARTSPSSSSETKARAETFLAAVK
jgi:tetratricopeptide (TPR) repeat protein